MRAPARPSPTHAPLAALLALALLAALAPAALAQGALSLPAFQHAGAVYLGVDALARALGVVAAADEHALTWRGAAGPTTFFAGSPDALARLAGAPGATDVTLSAPVLALGAAGWFVPLDALPFLGLEVPQETIRPAHLLLPDGRELALAYLAPSPLAGLGAAAATGLAGPAGPAEPGASASAPTAPAAPLPPVSGRGSWEAAEAPLAGVRFFDGEGVSLLLLDLALVPLAAPSLTGAVDAAIDRATEASAEHVLLLMVTSLSERPWEARLTFEQDGRRIEVAHPYRLLLELGDEKVVAPGAPVVGAVLLPPTFSLYRAMRVEWAGAAAEVRFRK